MFEDTQPGRSCLVYCITIQYVLRGLTRVVYPNIWAMREPARGIGK